MNEANDDYQDARTCFEIIQKEREMGEQMLPCPFCGESANLFILPGSAYALCLACGISQHLRETPEEAIADWNRRHKIKETEETACQLPQKSTGNPYITLTT